MTKQLPDDYYYYEFGKLSETELNDLSLSTKIDKEFLRNQKVLFRYTNRANIKGTSSSILPIQENWSFDISNLNNPKYIYGVRESIVFVDYVFLIGENYQTDLISYFSSLQQDNFKTAIPPSPQPVFSGVTNTVSTVTPPPPPPFRGRIFEPEIITEEELENFAVKRFDSAFAVYNSDIPIEQKDLIFNSSSNEEINKNIKEVDRRLSFIRQMIQEQEPDPTRPFSSPIGMKVEIYYLDMVKNYLYDQLRKLNDVGFPSEEPERYSVTDDGDIVIEPKKIEPTISNSTQNEINKGISEFDEFIDEIIEDLEVDDNNTYVFKKISKVADYDLPVLRYKTKGLFRCTGEKLSAFYTASLTQKQQKYYLSLRNEAEGTTDSYHQFDITYCHISGSGSSHIEGEVDLYPAKAMYRKYMLECFGNTEGKFPFKNGKNGDYFYAIQLDRTQYKEKLDVGNFEIALCELSSSGTVTSQTSTKLFTLIDESKDSKQQVITNEGIQEYYYVTSGSIRDGVYNESSDDAWGIVFPKMGLIILDGTVLDQSCSFSTITGSSDGQNSKRLFMSISGAAVPTNYRPSSSFFARSFETYLTETYFCRADFNEFNTSTNYTYTTGSNGFLKYDYFKKNPNSYITTVGLYNRKKELIAVGKLRNPILKNEGKSCIFEVVVRLN